MKNLLLLIVLAFSTTVFASNYKEAMIQNIEKLNKSQNATEIAELANAFDRIAQKETTEWLPLYYAAYSHINVTIFNQQLTVDEKVKIIDQAQQKLDAAKKITETESEIHALQALIYQMRITIDSNQAYKYLTLCNEALGRAETLNGNNPRVAYMRGTLLFYTPVEYGGGAAVAKPLFEKAAKLFSSANTTDQLMPSWGAYHNNMMLSHCK